MITHTSVRWPAGVRYALAIILVGLALLASLAFENSIGNPFWFFFSVAVILSTWFGGTGPGRFAVILSTLAVMYYFTPPLGSFSVKLSDLPYFVTFVACEIAVTQLISWRRRAEDSLRQARDELEVRVVERTMELQRAVKKLADSEQSSRELSQNLLRVQDEERRRIGRELHDSLGQSLTALKMRLDGLCASAECSPTVAAELREYSRLADESIKEVRTISYLMYPPLLEEIGLTAAIPWYLEGFSQRSGIETTFELSAGFHRLPLDAELAMFRVLQESLTNVHRHSGSSEAAVRLSVREAMAVLEISDTGKGLPAGSVEHGVQDWMGSPSVGLRGMNERMRQLGGTLELSSNQSGTTVTARIPVSGF